jgi:HlyD family secretion protein
MRAGRHTAVLGGLVAVALAFVGCDHPTEGVYQGWVEADLVFVGPDETGRVETLSVREGDTVAAGAPLFTLDADLQQADVQQNQATLANARQAFERAQQLLKSGSGTQKAFDDAQAALREIEARLNSAQTRLARRKVFSPAAGTIQQVYYRPGEMVAASRPVVSLLPPGNMKIRFFVPEAELPKFSYGETIRVSCDGCAHDITARISFIAKSAEFTPPVIYSLEERAKLVFLIEARTDNPEKLRVGQPVSVSAAPQEASR